jgi:hypothetical protein
MATMKYKKNIAQGSEKGIALYMTIAMMAVLFTMVLGVTVIIIRGSDILKGSSDSVKAFHAADTGIERALYNIRVNGNCSPAFCSESARCPLGGDNNWNYYLEYSTSTITDCSVSINIDAKGTYYSSQRKIEVSY